MLFIAKYNKIITALSKTIIFEENINLVRLTASYRTINIPTYINNNKVSCFIKIHIYV